MHETLKKLKNKQPYKDAIARADKFTKEDEDLNALEITNCGCVRARYAMKEHLPGRVVTSRWLGVLCKAHEAERGTDHYEIKK